MNRFIKIILWLFLGLQVCSITLATWKYEHSLNTAIAPIEEHLDPAPPDDPSGWWNIVVNTIFKILDDFVIPIAIAIWIIVWIIWALTLLFSSDEKATSNWLKLLVYWVIWIIIMVSAKYIWYVIFEDIFNSWNLVWMTGIELSKIIYNKIAYPFIKIALYLALAVIFIVLVGKSISLLTKSDGTGPKKALWMVWWSAVAILIIIWAKNIVEAIYWGQDKVFSWAANLWDIWSWILENKNIPIIYNIITRVITIISFVILLLLLIQWFKILINPSKSENFQKLWKSILYTLIWLFVIGIWYLLTNAFILN